MIGYIRNSRLKLSEDLLAKLSAPEIRAIAKDRGYVLGGLGVNPAVQSRSWLRRAFAAAQAEDATLLDSIEELAKDPETDGSIED